MKIINNSNELLPTLLSEVGTSVVTETALVTNEKVLARITDGIYRAPGSSLRELLSNAYDADATQVTVNTDAPRFERIIVRDNGQGMSLETLAYVVQNIGGSAKRTHQGQQLNVVSQHDSSLTPNGRKVIGKIGIGLFSVAHLSHHFKIITKVAGKNYRSHAEVVLAQYDEGSSKDNEGEYQQGKVRIWSEPAEMAEAQGTEITILDLKPSAVDILRSREVWSQLNERQAESKNSKSISSIVAPTFHIGEMSLENGSTLETTAVLPWDRDCTPKEKFQGLVTNVIDIAKRNPSQPPELESILDNYFYTMWTLGLALPLPYVNQNPLELSPDDGVGAYELSNASKGQATPLKVASNQSIGTAAGIETPTPRAPFIVEIDGVQLCRPIDILTLPITANSIKEPQVFVGKLKPDLSKVPAAYRGGELEIYGYFAWAPKVVPNEHQGVLIRINGASGALFDNTFLRYKVAERTRLTQIVAEIFVDVGLDGALNIDRESFNYTHPHYVIVQNWIHSALRQITNQLKDLAKTKRKTKAEGHAVSRLGQIEIAVAEEWEIAGRTEDEEVPKIVLVDIDVAETSASNGEIRLSKDAVLARISPDTKKSSSSSALAFLESDLKAIYQVLIAYRLFDKVPQETQEQIMAAIARIIDGGRK